MPTISDLTLAKTDDAAFTRLVQEDKRFILTSAYKATGRFITESDDEWSTALSAYYEAVQGYDVSKGSFQTFAGTVIKRRLIDFMRSEQRNQSIPVNPDIFTGNQDTEELNNLEKSVFQSEVSMAFREMSKTALKDEIDALEQDINKYPISFFELAECSPKAEKTKKACAKVIKVLIEDKDLFEKVQKTGKLPAKELLLKTWVSRKILENHRKYIIASAEILLGDYPQISEYLHFVKEEDL